VAVLIVAVVTAIIMLFITDCASKLSFYSIKEDLVLRGFVDPVSCSVFLKYIGYVLPP
jgi:hypothetical protein